MAVVDSPARRSERREILLDALGNMVVRMCNGWTILAAQTQSIDDGFALTESQNQLGGDVRMIGLPQGEVSIVMVECSAVMVEKEGVDLLQMVEKVAQNVKAIDTWGTPALGRILAPRPVQDLLDLCLDVFIDVYGNGQSN